MMKKNLFPVLFSITMVFFLSCQKEEILTNKKIVKVTRGNSFTTYAYDNQERVIKTESFNDTVKFHSEVFDYSQTNKIILQAQIPTIGLVKRISELNSNGLVNKSYPVNAITNIADTTKAIIYTFNADNQLIERNEKTVGNTVYTYLGGNLISSSRIIYTITNGVSTIFAKYENAYEYSTSVPNSLDAKYFGQQALGRESKDAPSKLTQSLIQTNNGVLTTTVITFDYTYEVDGEGLITKVKQKATGVQNGAPVITNSEVVYTYQ
jgi:hypothetical protein